jgi:ribosome-binding protein aMBF1 (putative translation factor)
MQCDQCDDTMAYHELSGVYTCGACGRVIQANNIQQAEQSELTICRMVLQFYADEANYEGAIPVLADRGQLAREALAAE